MGAWCGGDGLGGSVSMTGHMCEQQRTDGERGGSTVCAATRAAEEVRDTKRTEEVQRFNDETSCVSREHTDWTHPE